MRQTTEPPDRSPSFPDYPTRVIHNSVKPWARLNRLPFLPRIHLYLVGAEIVDRNPLNGVLTVHFPTNDALLNFVYSHRELVPLYGVQNCLLEESN